MEKINFPKEFYNNCENDKQVFAIDDMYSKGKRFLEGSTKHPNYLIYVANIYSIIYYFYHLKKKKFSINSLIKGLNKFLEKNKPNSSDEDKWWENFKEIITKEIEYES